MDTIVPTSILLLTTLLIFGWGPIEKLLGRRRRTWLNQHGREVTATVTRHESHLHISRPGNWSNLGLEVRSDFEALWTDPESGYTYTFTERDTPTTFPKGLREGDMVQIVFESANPKNFFVAMPITGREPLLTRLRGLAR